MAAHHPVVNETVQIAGTIVGAFLVIIITLAAQIIVSLIATMWRGSRAWGWVNACQRFDLGWRS